MLSNFVIMLEMTVVLPELVKAVPGCIAQMKFTLHWWATSVMSRSMDCER